MSNIQNIYEKKAYAKVNLILKVLNKRPDNYHNIFTLMHKIDLADIIKVSAIKNNKIIVKCDTDLGIETKENIVYKAATALLQHTNTKKGALIEIKKNIPTGAGLGGGSTDAATTLKLLNQLWELRLSMNTLHEIATTLGADVPFFLMSYPKWAYGKGEIYRTVDIIKYRNNRFYYRIINKYILLVYPNININTSEAYQKLNRPIEDINVNDDTYLKEIMEHEAVLENKENTNAFLEKNMINDFEEVIFKEHPKIEEIHKILSKLSNGKANLTGSGSAVFATFDNKYLVAEAETELREIFEKESKDYLIIKTKLTI